MKKKSEEDISLHDRRLTVISILMAYLIMMGLLGHLSALWYIIHLLIN